jgi:hypothetical protein
MVTRAVDQFRQAFEAGNNRRALMKQQTLTGFEKFGKTTRHAQFLADMDRIVPWSELTAVVDPVYPKVSEAGGRPPIALERMLRIYFLRRFRPWRFR